MREPELVERAADYAREVHAGDLRKGSGTSYFDGHLAPVAALVADAGGDPVQVAAAYLHDTAEDHGGHRRLIDVEARFGAEVAAIVADLSDSLVDNDVEEKAPWQERKESYLERLRAVPVRSLEVAVADKLHNASDLLADLRQRGDEVWARFTTGRAADQLWYYRALSDILTERLPGHPLTGQLAHVVEQLEATGDGGARAAGREPST